MGRLGDWEIGGMGDGEMGRLAQFKNYVNDCRMAAGN
jgi:hypothetical protein